MTSDWQGFLSAQGAYYENGKLLHFNNAAAEQQATVSGTIITDLSNQYGLIEIQGEDATSFLQNQLGNDVTQVSASHSQLNCYSSPKGRMFTSFRLFKHADSYYIRLPKSLLPKVMQRLQMFVLMAKVSLSDSSEQLARIAVADASDTNGTTLKQALAAHFPSLPNDTNACIHHADMSVLRVPGQQRYEIYGPIKTIQELWKSLSQQLTPSGDDSWPLLDIINGIPEVYPATSEHFVPQMANMQLIDGISFKKGCYPGQEVVARMQYLGKLKRRMYLLELDTAQPPQAGELLVNRDGEKQHEAGEIVDARAHPAGGCLALAVLQANSIDKPLSLAQDPATAIKLGKLPYAFEEATDA